MDFSIRSNELELLDQPEIPAVDIEQNMAELAIINEHLGGHAITVQGVWQLYRNQALLHVCEIGCGGGDNGKAIEKALRRKKIVLSYTGIDINPDCIRVAENKEWNSTTRFLISDYKKIDFETKPDILFCSLFCHHFKEAELVDMFRWMLNHSSTGFFINDLHRHPLAYHSIRLLTSLFSRSYLVKHDAPLSVLRGFTKKEMREILKKSGIMHYTVQWKWAFRWLIIVKHENNHHT